MKAEKHIAAYRRMRGEPLWSLLAADLGPEIIGLLQSHLYDEQRSLPASALFERLDRDLRILRANGHHLPQSPQTYVANWLRDGYLTRRLSAGAPEEEYELTTPAAEAIRFLAGIERPHSTVTTSRLSLVIQSMSTLADDTDTDRRRRLERLQAKKAQLDKDIESIEKEGARALPKELALERAREVIALAGDLNGDFRRVRDRFERLNRELREHILDTEGNRSDVLDSLFEGIDLIAESDAGRSFTAFWRLLTDPEQSARFNAAIDDIMERDFADALRANERKFLLRLGRNLLRQGGAVHEASRAFARSLKHFVQSREYLEQRRVNRLLKEAQRAARAVKDKIRANTPIDYTLTMTGIRARSLSQWALYDPAMQSAPQRMRPGDKPLLDLRSVSEMVVRSEIDFRALREHTRRVLETRQQATIGDVFAEYPATQGLGSVVGMLALGGRHGIRATFVGANDETMFDSEMVSWTGEDNLHRRARIPKIYFVRERADELA